MVRWWKSTVFKTLIWYKVSHRVMPYIAHDAPFHIFSACKICDSMQKATVDITQKHRHNTQRLNKVLI